MKGASKTRAMVPIKCVFLFLNAATFRGSSGQIHGVNIKKSQ